MLGGVQDHLTNCEAAMRYQWLFIIPFVMPGQVHILCEDICTAARSTTHPDGMHFDVPNKVN